MSYKKCRKKRFSRKTKRYWYHISTTLKDKYIQLIPWNEDKATNRDFSEPAGERICVAPTIEQCITALPYWSTATYIIYRTKSVTTAKHPRGVFDSSVTHEGWLQTPASFVKVGILRFKDVEKELGNGEDIIEEAASRNNVKASASVLRWWKRARIKRFIKRA